MNGSKQQNEVRDKRGALLSTVVLTLLFVGLYFFLRALPDAECGFLHYEEVVNEDGTIEFCATNHAGFLDLTLLEYPVKTKIEPAMALSPQVLTPMKLELTTTGGMSIAPHELAITHTEKIHMMLIDPSLQDYHHLHPEADGLDGDYTFTFEPKLAGEYQVFTELVPIRSRRQVIGVETIAVAGEAAEMNFERSLVNEIDDLRFALGGLPDTLYTGRDYQIDLKVTDTLGQAIQLEMIMGARGHMVAFDAERRGFAHMHPISSIATLSAGLAAADPASAEDAVSFMFNVPNRGWYRLFAQVQVEGEVVFGRFDLFVE